MVQAAQSTFLALFLAHLLGDFVFRWKWNVNDKGRGWQPLVGHGTMHYMLTWVCLLIFTHTAFLSIYLQAAIIVYCLIHLLIDRLNYLAVARHGVADTWPVFLFHQLLDVVVVAGAACVLTRSLPAALFYDLHPSPLLQFHILEAAIVYTGVVFGGGYLIRYLTKSFSSGSTTESLPRLENAGLYVGWIERFLVITAIVVQSPVLVGLILTGKSIARFPEFKEARFAEYFLIGTMLSLSLAIAGGILLQYLLQGTMSLKS